MVTKGKDEEGMLPALPLRPSGMPAYSLCLPPLWVSVGAGLPGQVPPELQMNIYIKNTWLLSGCSMCAVCFGSGRSIWTKLLLLKLSGFF